MASPTIYPHVKAIAIFTSKGFQATIDDMFQYHWASLETYYSDQKINHYHLNKVKRETRLEVFSSVFWVLHVIETGESHFRPMINILCSPPESYHPAMVLRPLFIEILKFCCDKVPNCSNPVTPLVPHIRDDYDEDELHYSELGHRQLRYNFTLLTKVIKSIQDGSKPFDTAIQDFNREVDDRHENGNIHPNNRHLLQDKSLEYKNGIFHKSCSKKDLAVINSFRHRDSKNQRGYETNKFPKVLTVLSDSLGRAFYDGSVKAKEARHNRTGFFCKDVCFAICPGAAFFHYAENFYDTTFNTYAQDVVYAQVLNLGVNDILNAFRAFSTGLCSRQQIHWRRCSACGRHDKKPSANKRKSQHGRSRQAKVFIAINYNYRLQFKY